MTRQATKSGAGRGVGVQAGGEASAPPPVLLDLPCPPSVNEMFRNVRGRGRVKTRAYIDWRGHAGWVVTSQRPERIGGHVLIMMSIERGSSSADIDNRVKAIFDLLVEHDVIDDDRFVVGFAIAWAPPANKMARVLIIPATSITAEFHLAADGAHGGWFLSAPTNSEISDALSA